MPFYVRPVKCVNGTAYKSTEKILFKHKLQCYCLGKTKNVKKLWLEGKGKLFHQWAKLRTKGPEGPKTQSNNVINKPKSGNYFSGRGPWGEKIFCPTGLALTTPDLGFKHISLKCQHKTAIFITKHLKLIVNSNRTH